MVSLGIDEKMQGSEHRAEELPTSVSISVSMGGSALREAGSRGSVVVIKHTTSAKQVGYEHTVSRSG